MRDVPSELAKVSVNGYLFLGIVVLIGSELVSGDTVFDDGSNAAPPTELDAV